MTALLAPNPVATTGDATHTCTTHDWHGAIPCPACRNDARAHDFIDAWKRLEDAAWRLSQVWSDLSWDGDGLVNMEAFAAAFPVDFDTWCHKLGPIYRQDT